MRTFCIQTLGCKVNQYESEQLAALLRARGLVEADAGSADLRIVNTCSVTVQAASKSRQTVRRTVRLPLLARQHADAPSQTVAAQRTGPDDGNPEAPVRRARVVATGCWATSHRDDALGLRGVDAVLTHQDDVAASLSALLDRWMDADDATVSNAITAPQFSDLVNENHGDGKGHGRGENQGRGTFGLPLLHDRVAGHQRAYLKIQDGCDAHCTYCIIPKLRSSVWSKPIEEAVQEAKNLVAAGHRELILTGIFLGAYGQPTALRRRQAATGKTPLARLVEALCTRVPGLLRLRLSSIEPGDLTDDLQSVLGAHRQVVPHFHVPLQSGSDALLRRMNRQYTREDYLRMLDRLNESFDRPALTTDIIVGFPAEDDQRFMETVEVVQRARFIHMHAFPFSPRPGTAAARWTKDFVRGPVVNQRMNHLVELAEAYSQSFRQQFLGQTVQLLVERDQAGAPLQQGRCERYFAVHFEGPRQSPGTLAHVRIDRVTPTRTLGTLLHAQPMELAS